MKIGITEGADAGRDLAWTERIKDKNGLILITKTITDEFIRTVTRLDMTKIILHVTCTGLGGSRLEPGVFSIKQQVEQAVKLIDAGFPADHVVFRIDPIVPPYLSNTREAFSFFKALHARGVKRIRYSIMDLYPHVRKRLMEDVSLREVCSCYDGFTARAEWHDEIEKLLADVHAMYPGCSIEACAETSSLPFVEHVGCCSKKDLTLLGLQMPEEEPKKNRREGCLCLSCKTELFPWKEIGQHPCPNHCIYCYWKTAEETNSHIMKTD